MKNIFLLATLLAAFLMNQTPASAASASSPIASPGIVKNEAQNASGKYLRKQNKLEKRLDRLQKKWEKRTDRLRKKGNVEASLNLSVIGLIVLVLGGLFILLGIAIPVVGVLFIVIGAIIAFVGLVLLLLLNFVKIESGSGSH